MRHPRPWDPSSQGRTARRRRTLALFRENRGKREALHQAVTHLLDDDVAFVVTIDSDTILEPDALVRVVEPPKEPGVGASTGNVRGYIRESIYTLSYAWRNKRLLWLQILCWDLTAPFLSFGLRVALVMTAIRDPRVVLTVILPSWIVLMLIRYVFVPLRARDKVVGLFLYMLFYEACLYWLNVWALFTVKNRSWVTRR
jgi:hypothetical protein